MNFQARFGSVQSNLGVQFYNASGTLLGSRIIAGIVAMPEAGTYGITATPPTGATGIYWNDSVTLATAIGEVGSDSDYPTVDEIIAAAGGLTVETAAALEAADQIILASLYVPSEAPALIIPAPDPDESLTVCYVYTESITNAKRAGIEVTFRLVSTPAKSERVLEIAPKTMTTDADGYAQITLQRGHRYKVTCRELGIDSAVIATVADTLNLDTLIQ